MHTEESLMERLEHRLKLDRDGVAYITKEQWEQKIVRKFDKLVGNQADTDAEKHWIKMKTRDQALLRNNEEIKDEEVSIETVKMKLKELLGNIGEYKTLSLCTFLSRSNFTGHIQG